nr:CDGSH iron-sulfur domain-containing protein [Rhodoferax sp. PAMC 29310]
MEQGKDYYWCACGLSKSQPFCDGSHKVASSLRLNIVQQKARTFIFSVAKHPPVNLTVTEATRNKHQIADGATL